MKPGGVMKISAAPEEAELMERAIQEGCEGISLLAGFCPRLQLGLSARQHRATLPPRPLLTGKQKPYRPDGFQNPSDGQPGAHPGRPSPPRSPSVQVPG